MNQIFGRKQSVELLCNTKRHTLHIILELKFLYNDVLVKINDTLRTSNTKINGKEPRHTKTPFQRTYILPVLWRFAISRLQPGYSDAPDYINIHIYGYRDVPKSITYEKANIIGYQLKWLEEFITPGTCVKVFMISDVDSTAAVQISNHILFIIAGQFQHKALQELVLVTSNPLAIKILDNSVCLGSPAGFLVRAMQAKAVKSVHYFYCLGV